MSRRDPTVSLHHMLDYAREAYLLAQDHTRAEFDSNRILNLALTRLLEIIGESANRIPVENQLRHPGIDWTQIIGMRNRLIHGYDILDLDVVWDTITEDLPTLIQALESILESQE